MNVDLDEIWPLFQVETEEDLATVEQALLRLEKAPGDHECVATLFRKFHTLKGNAATVGRDGLAAFAHRIEDLLAEVRSGGQEVTPALISYLLQVVDGIRVALPTLAGGEQPLPAGVRGLLERIEGGRLQGSEGAPEPGEVLSAELEPSTAARTLRVDVGKLDSLLSIAGEIAIARGRLAAMIDVQAAPGLASAYHTLERLLTGMHHSVSKVRMVSIGPVLRQYARVVRDLAVTHHKQAELVVSDHGVEVDNSVVEQLKAPLTHMIRNAVHHGLESPEARRRAGKEPRGRIEVWVRQEGSDIVVGVADDGAGLDRPAILARARALGIATDELKSDREVDRLIFTQGLSTAKRVTGTSGRGVGMDVVLRHIDALGGSVDVQSQSGQGTTFVVRMPLTLAIVEGLVVRVGGATVVIPMAGVLRCLELGTEAGPSDLDGVLNLRGRAVPFARLRPLFGLTGAPPAREVAVIVEREGHQMGLAVDSLVGRAQVVIKPPGRFFAGLPAISGMTILGDGQVAPILNVAGLVHDRLRGGSAAAPAAAAGGPHA